MKTVLYQSVCFLMVISYAYGESFDIELSKEEQAEREKYSSVKSMSDEEPDIISTVIDFSKFKHEAVADEYLYHVAIMLRPIDVILCQGALVASNWILTSASCYKMYSSLEDSINLVAGAVIANDTNAIIGYLSDVEYHPLYRPLLGVNDLALVKLNESIKGYNERTKSISLSSSELPVGTWCTYSSYEKLKLYGYSLKLMDQSKCAKVPILLAEKLKYICVGAGNYQFITDTDILTQLAHVGTPLVCGGDLYAIKTNDGIFTTVNETSSWINSIIEIS